MSKNRLDLVETFDQLGHDHWKALGTKLGGIENVKRILRDIAKVTVEINRRLTTFTSFTMPASKRDVLEFFQSQRSLYLSDEFQKLILAAVTKGIHQVDEATRGYSKFTEQASDVEIGAELPAGHVFDTVNGLLVFLAALLEAKWLNKRSSPLIATGKANIFYVKVGGGVFAVYVYCETAAGLWFCHVLELGSSQWLAGSRVFSATGT